MKTPLTLFFFYTNKFVRSIFYVTTRSVKSTRFTKSILYQWVFPWPIQKLDYKLLYVKRAKLENCKDCCKATFPCPYEEIDRITRENQFRCGSQTRELQGTIHLSTFCDDLFGLTNSAQQAHRPQYFGQYCDLCKLHKTQK